MGLGDFLDALVESNPATAAVKSGVKWGLEKLGEESVENMDRSQRGRAGGIGITATPGFQRATTIATNPANTPYRIVGEQTQQYGENKIEAAQGYYKLAKLAVTHPTEIYKGGKAFVSAVREDPSILGHIAVEAGVATALDPMTYMGGGVVSGAAITEGFAARGGRRAITEVLEEGGQAVAHSADEIAAATTKVGARELAEQAAREAAPAGIEQAIAAGGRRTTRSGRFLEALDQAPANLREAITDRPVGRLGQARIDLGERLMPGAQTSIPRALVKDALQSSPTLPIQGAGLGYRQAVWRASQVGRRLSAPGRLHTATRVGQILNDPVRALTSPEAQGYAVRGAEWVIREHPEAVAAVGGLVAASQAYGAYNTLRGLTGGFEGEGEKEPRPAPATPEPDTAQAIGLQQFQLDNTRATRVSRRRPGGRSRLGTITKTTTMSSEIGPSDWYGPQGGYQAGRGFQRPTGPLPALEQPAVHERAMA